MTAATQDIVSPRYGAEDQVLPDLIQIPVATATTIYGGTLVMVNASGYAVPAAAATSGAPGLIVGRCQRQVVNTTANGYGAAGALQVLVDRGAFMLNLNADSTVTIASFGQNVYASDDNTVSLSDAGGTRPYAGYLLSTPTTPGIPGLVNGTAATKVAVQVGQPNPWAQVPGQQTSQALFRARNVVTSLQAYGGSGTGTLTETSNGAWATQDTGVTNVVGDVVFIPAQTTNLTGAVDSGPWVIQSLGGASAKWVLIRPDWFITGSTIVAGTDISIDGEGTAWGGNTFRAMCATGQVVGTNDPTFYPRMQQVTTAAMTAGVSTANSTLFVWKNAQVGPLPKTPGGTQGTLRMSTQTSGYPGTSSLVVTSSSNTDTSTVTIQVDNF